MELHPLMESSVLMGYCQSLSIVAVKQLLILLSVFMISTSEDHSVQYHWTKLLRCRKTWTQVTKLTVYPIFTHSVSWNNFMIKRIWERFWRSEFITDRKNKMNYMKFMLSYHYGIFKVDPPIGSVTQRHTCDLFLAMQEFLSYCQTDGSWLQFRWSSTPSTW